MADQSVLFEKKGGIGTITLNRPDKLNAINFEMIDGILEIIEETAGDETIRVLVLKGAGRAFSAGDDLKGMGRSSRNIPKDSLTEQEEGPFRVVKALRYLMKPVIASVHGYAMAAACELVLACDLIIAAEDARIGVPFVQRGLASGTYLIPLTVGYHKACELLFLGDWITGKEAERIGMINRAVPTDELDQEVGRMAERLANSATLAIGHMKRAMNNGPLADFDAGFTLESLMHLPVMNSEDAQEGYRAFAEKREPRYKGR